MIINQSWFCFYEQLSHSDAIDESFFSSREEQLMYLYHYITFNPFFSSYFTGAWTFIQNFHCLQLSIMFIAINVISSAEGSYWCFNVTFWITATSFVLFCIFLNLSFLSLSFWWKLQIKQFLVESWRAYIVSTPNISQHNFIHGANKELMIIIKRLKRMLYNQGIPCIFLPSQP